jgi:hypothetical protein
MVAVGIHWGTGKSALTYKGQKIAKTPMKYDQWVLEYNKNPEERPHSAFPAHKSTEPKVSTRTMDDWHKSMGHINEQALKYLPIMAKGVKFSTNSLSTECCEECRLASARRIISRIPRTRGNRPFFRVSWDLIELKNGFNDSVYILHCLCDFSRFCMVFLLRNRREDTLLAALKQCAAYVKRRWGFDIVIWKHDGERGIGKAYNTWIAEEGYTVEQSPPDTQDQNGDSERSGGVLINRATLLRLVANLPLWMWPEIFQCAGYLLNRTPTRSLQWKTPLGFLQEFLGIKDSNPQLAHVRPYGCRAYAFIKNRPRLDKLEPKAHIGYLVGYDSTNIFRIWIPTRDEVISTRDVTFDPNTRYSPQDVSVEVRKEVIETISIPTLSDQTLEEAEDDTPLPAHLLEYETTIDSPGDTIIVETPGTSSNNLGTTQSSLTQNLSKGYEFIPSLSYPSPENSPSPKNIGPDSYQLPEDLPEPENQSESILTDREKKILSDLESAVAPLATVLPPSTTSDYRAADTSSSRPKTYKRPTSQRKNKGKAVEDPVVANQSSPTAHRSAEDPEETSNLATDQRQVKKLIAPKEINSSISDANIIVGSRRARRQVQFAVAREQLGNDGAFHAAFALGQTPPPNRLHSSTLPPPPKNWKELANHPHRQGFETAARKEFNTLQGNTTFESVHKSKIGKAFVIPMMWVFTYKFNSDGYLIKFKARVVVRGDLVPASKDETYAATLAARMFRVLMALAAYFDLDMHQFDAINAFTNASLDETVYVRYPEGFSEPHHVLKLRKALYGLPKSPKYWFNELSGTFTMLGLHQVAESPCVFVSDKLIVFFFVDDIAVLCHPSNHEAYLEFRKGLMEAYNMHEIGDLKWFLGIRVIRNRSARKIWLCQDSYAESVATRFKRNNLLDKAPKTPMRVEGLQPYSGQATEDEIYRYQSKVGSLTYSSYITRADMARATSELSRYQQNPGPEHHEAADRAIDYFYSTRNFALELGGELGDSKIAFIAAADASYADDKTTRRSSEGALFKLFNGLIDWTAKLQTTVTTSTTEAELLALSHIAGWLLYWARFFDHVDLELGQQLIIWCDNLQTVRLMNKEAPKLVTKLKHIDIHQHWLRQEASEGRIQVQWVASNEMPADGLTKLLTAQQHKAFLAQINMVDISNLITFSEKL